MYDHLFNGKIFNSHTKIIITKKPFRDPNINPKILFANLLFLDKNARCTDFVRILKKMSEKENMLVNDKTRQIHASKGKIESISPEISTLVDIAIISENISPRSLPISSMIPFENPLIPKKINIKSDNPSRNHAIY
tara:strand:- start:9339 stop:9746 length:408 start_codon:yes stop_codon:yes gene_type:complete